MGAAVDIHSLFAAASDTLPHELRWVVPAVATGLTCESTDRPYYGKHQSQVLSYTVVTVVDG